MESESDNKKEVPEFKPEWFWAFAVLMLYKIGGREIITVDLLEKFDIEYCPEVIYDHDMKAFIMQLKKEYRPTMLMVPKGIRKKLIKTPKVIGN